MKSMPQKDQKVKSRKSREQERLKDGKQETLSGPSSDKTEFQRPEKTEGRKLSDTL